MHFTRMLRKIKLNPRKITVKHQRCVLQLSTVNQHLQIYHQPIKPILTDHQPIKSILTDHQQIKSMLTDHQPIKSILTDHQPIKSILTGLSSTNQINTYRSINQSNQYLQNHQH